MVRLDLPDWLLHADGEPNIGDPHADPHADSDADSDANAVALPVVYAVAGADDNAIPVADPVPIVPAYANSIDRANADADDNAVARADVDRFRALL